VDLSQGNVRPILPTENNTSFLGVDDNKIYFWENIKPDQQASDNLTGTSGKAFSEYPRYRFRIYFLVKSQPGNPQRLTNFDFELPRFFREADKDYWWVVTYGENRKLGRLYRDGRIEEIISLEPNWYFLYSSRKVSPNQKYAALGLYNFEHGPFFRDLVVIDLNQKELIFKKERISVKDPMSSIITNPWYNYYWLDDTSLLYQEQLYFRVWFDVDSLLAGKDDPQEEKRAGQNLPWWHDPNNEPNWIEVEVETGQTRKVDIKEMIKSGKFIPPRIRPDRETRGYFELDYGEVYYKGEETPVGSVLNNRGSKVQDLEVCPKGEWAAFVSPVGSNFNLYIVDGKKKKKTLLMRGWCGDLKWLPSVK